MAFHRRFTAGQRGFIRTDAAGVIRPDAFLRFCHLLMLCIQILAHRRDVRSGTRRCYPPRDDGVLRKSHTGNQRRSQRCRCQNRFHISHLLFISMLLFYTVIIIQVTARYNRTFLEGQLIQGNITGSSRTADVGQLSTAAICYQHHNLCYASTQLFVTEGIKKRPLRLPRWSLKVTSSLSIRILFAFCSHFSWVTSFPS
jgi:hypothetical protein